MDTIEKHPMHKAVNLKVKITTLKVKLLQQILAIKKLLRKTNQVVVM